MDDHDIHTPALPQAAFELRAALTESVIDVGREALQGTAPMARMVCTAVLQAIQTQAEVGAAALLADVAPERDRLADVLTVRAWLLAVALGAHRLVGTTHPETASLAASPGIDRLRDRYQDDLAAAHHDGILPLVDDLLDV